MKWFLIVTFLNASGGYDIHPGFHPLMVDDEATCLSRLGLFQRTLDASNLSGQYKAYCRELEVL